MEGGGNFTWDGEGARGNESTFWRQFGWSTVDQNKRLQDGSLFFLCFGTSLLFPQQSSLFWKVFNFPLPSLNSLQNTTWVVSLFLQFDLSHDGFVPLFSGSTSSESKRVAVGFSATTSSTGKSQVCDTANGSIGCSEGSLPLPFPGGQILKWPNLKVFSFEELKSATKNFNSESLVGEGGFGSVYKGWLDEETLSPATADSGTVVAIKMFTHDSSPGFQMWQVLPWKLARNRIPSLVNLLSEINFLGRLSDPNLVKLLGYCWDEDKLLLVHEFMSKGSLENHLFKANPNIEALSWNSRLKIAICAARGLAFLHVSERRVIYRDFKASNILLDGNYNAKISDFGLARLGPLGEKSHVTTRILGTHGYTAPEYTATGHLYVKSDVYGFGVVLLELLTGMRVLDLKRPIGKQNLVEWTKSYLSSKKKLKTIMDVKIKGQYAPKAAWQAAQLTLKCLESNHKQRPSMTDVREALEAIEAIQNSKFSAQFSSISSAELLQLFHTLSKFTAKHDVGRSPFPPIRIFLSRIRLDPLFSGSTTTSSTTKSQFSEVGSGSSSGEGSLPRPLPLPLPFRDGPILKWPNLKVFSFEELKSATKNFRPDTFVGEGDFGLVYKGWLDEKTLSPVQEDSGMPVAIKTLDPNITESFQASTFHNQPTSFNPAEEQTTLHNTPISFSPANPSDLCPVHSQPCPSNTQPVLYQPCSPETHDNHPCFSQPPSVPAPSLELSPKTQDNELVISVLIFTNLSTFRVINLDDYLTCYSAAWKMQSEVNFLGRLSHPNLVKLLGYCWDEDKLLLVYEFVARGSLETHLFKRSFKPLSWNSRLKIAIGAARGLAFLHASERLVIYRDLKATNILLDGNYNAKISDFGSARLGPSGEKTHVSTRIIGSFGYTAPEYSATGHLYVKSDVYGFGVVLLELLTGMRAFDKRRPKEQHILVEWTKAYLSSKKKLEAVMDDKIKGQYSLEAALQAAQLILKCVEHDHKLRPSMKDVLVALEAIEAIQNR
ncbi:hypothetical protein VNO78_34392 [Psophocarpus tetragonolobus]|uniref:Protein kinase domain-containing protein n=1 Tax=Psophocarpus tetragonolobus TaxID=3891 RepID=A0AAN9P214_PSOTE